MSDVNDTDVVEIDGWTFPKEWFGSGLKCKDGTTGMGARIDITPNDGGRHLQHVNCCWVNFKDRLLTQDFTGIKLEQFWEMVEYLA